MEGEMTQSYHDRGRTADYRRTRAMPAVLIQLTAIETEIAK